MVVKKSPIINLQIDTLKSKNKLKRTLVAIANFTFQHDLEN